MAREARRAFEPQARHQRERIGRDRQHPAGADPDDRAVVPRARAHQHLLAARAEVRRDQALEHLGRDLAERGKFVAHASLRGSAQDTRPGRAIEPLQPVRAL